MFAISLWTVAVGLVALSSLNIVDALNNGVARLPGEFIFFGA